MYANLPTCPQSVVVVPRAGEAAAEEGYGAVSAARRPAGSALGRVARCCAVVAAAAVVVAAVAGGAGDPDVPADLTATRGYAGADARARALLRQQSAAGSRMSQLQLEAGVEAVAPPAGANETQKHTARGNPQSVQLYPGEPDPDENGSDADWEIIRDEEQDEMFDPPDGYQGAFLIKVVHAVCPSGTLGMHSAGLWRACNGPHASCVRARVLTWRTEAAGPNIRNQDPG